MTGVFSRHEGIEQVLLYGSRAKGDYRKHSDIDLALVGDPVGLSAEAIAMDLDDLPLPYHFDVKPYGAIANALLRAHIDRIGVGIYRKMEAKC